MLLISHERIQNHTPEYSDSCQGKTKQGRRRLFLRKSLTGVECADATQARKTGATGPMNSSNPGTVQIWLALRPDNGDARQQLRASFVTLACPV
jgi:hypothetical protein